MERLPQRRPADIIHEQRKEKILQDSPLLFAYFDKKVNIDEWSKNVQEEIERYERHFDNTLQSGWQFWLVPPLRERAYKDRLFFSSSSEFHPEEHINQISTQLIFMGYEIGEDIEMRSAFTEDIFQEMSKYKIINKKTKQQKLKEFIRMGLDTGVHYSLCEKDMEIMKKRKEIVKTSDPRLDPFRNFVNSLDLTDI